MITPTMRGEPEPAGGKVLFVVVAFALLVCAAFGAAVWFGALRNFDFLGVTPGPAAGEQRREAAK